MTTGAPWLRKPPWIMVHCVTHRVVSEVTPLEKKSHQTIHCFLTKSKTSLYMFTCAFHSQLRSYRLGLASGFHEASKSILPNMSLLLPTSDHGRTSKMSSNWNYNRVGYCTSSLSSHFSSSFNHPAFPMWFVNFCEERGGQTPFRRSRNACEGSAAGAAWPSETIKEHGLFKTIMVINGT